ncbi:MAG: nucleoside-diphosphate kinase [Candidatus Omnitrophota bacterium]
MVDIFKSRISSQQSQLRGGPFIETKKLKLASTVGLSMVASSVAGMLFTALPVTFGILGGISLGYSIMQYATRYFINKAFKKAGIETRAGPIAEIRTYPDGTKYIWTHPAFENLPKIIQKLVLLHEKTHLITKSEFIAYVLPWIGLFKSYDISQARPNLDEIYESMFERFANLSPTEEEAILDKVKLENVGSGFEKKPDGTFKLDSAGNLIPVKDSAYVALITPDMFLQDVAAVLNRLRDEINGLLPADITRYKIESPSYHVALVVFQDVVPGVNEGVELTDDERQALFKTFLEIISAKKAFKIRLEGLRINPDGGVIAIWKDSGEIQAIRDEFYARAKASGVVNIEKLNKVRPKTIIHTTLLRILSDIDAATLAALKAKAKEYKDLTNENITINVDKIKIIHEEQWLRADKHDTLRVVRLAKPLSFVMIKPEGMTAKGRIIDMLKARGLTIVYEGRPMSLTEAQAREFYITYKGQPYYEGLVKHITSGEVIPILVRSGKENAIADVRDIIGPLRGIDEDGNKTGIRGELMTNEDREAAIVKNYVHASDSIANVVRETSIVIGADVLQYYVTIQTGTIQEVFDFFYGITDLAKLEDIKGGAAWQMADGTYMDQLTHVREVVKALQMLADSNYDYFNQRRYPKDGKELNREAFGKAGAAYDELMQEAYYREVLQIFIALHDYGKIWGDDHYINGAREIVPLLQRVGVGEDKIKLVQALILRHSDFGELYLGESIPAEDIKFLREFGFDIDKFQKMQLILHVCDVNAVGEGRLTANQLEQFLSYVDIRNLEALQANWDKTRIVNLMGLEKPATLESYEDSVPETVKDGYNAIPDAERGAFFDKFMSHMKFRHLAFLTREMKPKTLMKWLYIIAIAVNLLSAKTGEAVNFTWFTSDRVAEKIDEAIGAMDFAEISALNVTEDLASIEITGTDQQMRKVKVSIPIRLEDSNKTLVVDTRGITKQSIETKIQHALDFVRKIKKPLRVLMVMPMYSEESRLLPQSAENPLGEDALRKKVEELQAIARVNPLFEWRLIAVDDGTPSLASAKCAEKLWKEIREEYARRGEALHPSQVTIEAITPEEKEAIGSRKGGAVLLGLREAVKQGWADYIGYTDVDTSIDLRQIGLLIEPLYEEKADVAIGSRWVKGAVIKNMSPLGIISSRIYNYVVRILLPPLRNIKDTQRGFKLYKRQVLESILPHAKDRTLAFDTELLLLAKLAGYHISETPIYWYESVGARTFNMSREAPKMVRAMLKQREHIAKHRHFMGTFLKYPNPRRPNLKLDAYDREHYYWDKEKGYWRSKDYPRLVLGTWEDVKQSTKEGAAPTDMENHVAIRMQGYAIYVFGNHSYSDGYLEEATARGEVERYDNNQIFIDDHPDTQDISISDARVALTIAEKVYLKTHIWTYFDEKAWNRGRKILGPDKDLTKLGVENQRCHYSRYFEIAERPHNTRVIFNIDTDAAESRPILNFIEEIVKRDDVTPSTVHISTSPPNVTGEETYGTWELDGFAYPEGYGTVERCRTLARDLPAIFTAEAATAGIIIGVAGISEDTAYNVNKEIAGIKLVALNGKNEKENLEKLEEARKTYGAYASGIVEAGVTGEKELRNIVEELRNAIEKEDRRLFVLANPEIAKLTSETIKDIAGIEQILSRIIERIPVIRSMRTAELSVYELRIDRIAKAHQVISRDALLAQKLARIKESGKTKVASFRAHNVAELRWLANEHREALQKYGKENYPVELHIRLVDENVTEKNLDRVLELAGVSDVITRDNITLTDGDTLAEIYALIQKQFGEVEAKNVAIGDVRDLKLDKKLLKDILYVNMPASEGIVSQLYPVIVELIANNNARPRLMPQGVGVLEQPEAGLFYFIFKPIRPINMEELRREIEQYEKVLIAA